MNERPLLETEKWSLNGDKGLIFPEDKRRKLGQCRHS